MAQITVRDLALGYDSHVIADKLNFSVSSGDYLCIVGENGSGKTTLMKTLLHLQPPVKGEILIGDGLKANEIGYLDGRTKGLSCLCIGNCTVWFSGADGFSPVL